MSETPKTGFVATRPTYSLNLLVGFCNQYFQVLPKIFVCCSVIQGCHGHGKSSGK